MQIILLILLSAFLSANLILLEQKYILNHLNGNEFFCIKNILFFIIIILYMTFINRSMYNKIQKVEFKNYKLILIFDTLLTIANIMIWYYLLQNREAHKLIGTVNPLTIALSVVLAYAFYDAKITTNEMIGILLVLIGIIFINKE